MILRTLSACLLLLPAFVHAQDGTLDLTFNEDGVVLSNVYFSDDQVQAVAVQADGRVVGAGYIDDGTTVGTLVQRFLQDGTPDPDFGTGGVVFSGLNGELRYAYGVGLQSDGGIVVTGVIYDASMDANVMLLRYLPDGTLDPAFGTNGLVSSDLGAPGFFQSAWAMHVLPDDRIVIIGENGENGVSCACFQADGTLDDTFGVDGVVSTGIPFGSGLCLAVQPDGAILAGGYRILDGASDWLLARFRPSGILDPTFGDGGITTTDIGSDDIEIMRGLSIFPDGRILACGYRGNAAQDHIPALAMYDANGDPVTVFGDNGVLLLPFTAPQWGQLRAVHAQADNKMLVAGFRGQTGGPENNDILLYRLLEDGTPDPTFDSGGQVYVDLTGGIDQAMAMAISPDGSIVLGGFGTDGGRNTAYARFVNHVNTGITSLDAAAPRIYPVPARDHVFVEGTDLGTGTVQATLSSIDGRTVDVTPRTGATAGNPLRIDLPTGLATGTYVLRLRSDNAHVDAPILIEGAPLR